MYRIPHSNNMNIFKMSEAGRKPDLLITSQSFSDIWLINNTILINS